ncbi:hypothetical protein EVAR_43050_1 [Eumeta japonica]|uniref:Uncharacterized protein n=1 Tax=Eumeta variegata TaxID=151549 RepID=A0A4C1XN95_EUMVA|nr:hypothetical protein EVAR_43050_1 [Eumeta japonica]
MLLQIADKRQIVAVSLSVIQLYALTCNVTPAKQTGVQSQLVESRSFIRSASASAPKMDLSNQYDRKAQANLISQPPVARGITFALRSNRPTAPETANKEFTKDWCAEWRRYKCRSRRTRRREQRRQPESA